MVLWGDPGQEILGVETAAVVGAAGAPRPKSPKTEVRGIRPGNLWRIAWDSEAADPARGMQAG